MCELLTLSLLTTTIVAPPSNASKWQMGFNSAFKVLSYVNLNLLTTTIVAPPSNASKWQMGFNSAFKGLKWTEGHRRLGIYVLLRNKCFVAANVVCRKIDIFNLQSLL